MLWFIKRKNCQIIKNKFSDGDSSIIPPYVCTNQTINAIKGSADETLKQGEREK